VVNGKTVPERVSHKFFPCFTESQGPVALMLDVRKSVDPSEVEAISLRVTKTAWRQGAGVRTSENRKWDPPTPDVAGHSFPYLMVKALISGPISISSFSLAEIQDPQLRPLMAKVTVDEDPEFTARRASHHEENAVLEVALKDGRQLSLSSAHPRGHVMNPMTDDELTQKFDSSVRMVLPPPEHEELRRRLWNLPAEPDLSRITGIFRQFSTDGAASYEGRN
jgi:2-methylcitrate dehydratase